MHDGEAVNVERFEPDGEPASNFAGVIQIIHGFGQHIGHYRDMGKFLTGNGFVCVIHELRGFGEMPGKTGKQLKVARGTAPGYEYYLEDIKTIREKINQWYAGLPVILFGFSMGGNIAVNYLLKYQQEQYTKLILEAPWLRLYKPLPAFVTLLAGLIGKINRNLTISTHFKADYVSRNQDIINQYVKSR
uniref:Putative lysophospholipase n=1 Tax=uncultured bacterium contig00002 TaxID=1181494 RepID=A0A806JZ20_9BACT|nr:putative lysophospholipase [uncultured bacterium contig00002]